MKEQIFSANNFQEIFDSENRKGKDIEERFKDFFIDSIELRKKIKTLSIKINKENDNALKSSLKDERKDLKNKREEIIYNVLEKVSENINKAGYSINISKGSVYGKTSYQLENTIENLFLSKQLQKNIHQNYKIKQSSRFEILSLFKNLLEDGFPKIIIRTDIKSFYESIPQKEIIQKIKEDNLLSIKTQKFIRDILNEYNILTDQKEEFKGVPRGIGVSAYLSELYMRAIDNKIKGLQDLIFYARYVDDIIAVFTPQKEEKGLLIKYKSEVYSIIEESKLTINEKKTNQINLFKDLKPIDLNNKSSKPIEFLGYKIGSKKVKKDINDNEDINENYLLSIELSKRKLDKYKLKIKLAYDDFEQKSKNNRRRSFKLLLARMEYLTNNTKLRNNKSNVFVGIYYSNPFLVNCESLSKLNRSNLWRISRICLSANEKKQLLKYDFVEGFNKQTFKQIPLVRKIYKNHNVKSGQRINKGILQFGISEITKVWENAKS